MFFLVWLPIKLMFWLVWLPIKLAFELLEHSSHHHRRHHTRRRRAPARRYVQPRVQQRAYSAPAIQRQPTAPWPVASAPDPCTVPGPGRRSGPGWPVWGLLAAGNAFVLGLIVGLAGGGGQHSPAMTATAALWMAAILVIMVCVPAALVQWAIRQWRSN